jgi:hypothetical protein
MRMFRFDELPKAIVLAWTILVFAGLANAQPSAKLDDDDDKKSATPPGLYITPTALANAVQQPLNPGLTNYPNFVAGQAVKAVVSPDGKTLAILTAGMNSLYYPNAAPLTLSVRSTRRLPHSSSFYTTLPVRIKANLS